MNEAVDPALATRRVHPVMRAVLVAGVLFSFGAGVQLFVLTTSTDRFFAWTIGSALTAAFLGSFYWASVVLAALSAREAIWARARAPLPGLFVFLLLMLAATLLHADKFHFGSGIAEARGAAWGWLLIYVGYPAGFVIAYWFQRRVRGADPPLSAPLPVAYRAALGLHAVVTFAYGVALFVAPATADDWWPWQLTPLTARAIGAWLVGVGIVLAVAVRENDWQRLRIATGSYAVLGMLLLIATARFSSELDDSLLSWLYVAFLVTVVLVGLIGVAPVPRGALRARGAQPL